MIGTLIIETTSRCNLKCDYCFNSCDSNGRDMDYPIFSKIIDNLKLYNEDCKIILTGGEPLYHKNLPKLLSKIAESNVSSTIYTNGTLLNKKLVEELRDYGIEKLQISIDGITPAGNRFRGPDSTLIVLNNISAAQNSKLYEIEISCVLSTANYNYIDELIDYFKQRNIKIVFSFLTLEGRALHNRYELDASLIGKALIHLDKLKKDNNISMPACGLAGDCPLLVKKNITPYFDSVGNMYPCVGLREKAFILSNINDDDFSFDISQHPMFVALNKLLLVRGEMMNATHCSKCFFVNSNCNGGCLSSSILEQSDIFKQSKRCSAFNSYGKYRFIKKKLLTSIDFNKSSKG